MRQHAYLQALRLFAQPFTPLVIHQRPADENRLHTRVWPEYPESLHARLHHGISVKPTASGHYD